MQGARPASGSSRPRTPSLVLDGREVPLGGPRAMLVRRTLPHRDLHMVGPWCFLDHFGPVDVAGAGGMRVPPHPHTGLQTVTWLLEGSVLHKDSLGTTEWVRPGELNLMTAGHGISHSEDSPSSVDASAARHRAAPPTGGSRLHGVQLWIALPAVAADAPAAFEHHAGPPAAGGLPRIDSQAGQARVLVGEVDGVRSPATVFSPAVGVEVLVHADAALRLPLRHAFEHAVMGLDGPVEADGAQVPRGALAYLEPGRRDVTLAASRDTLVLLIGGEPFGETLVMWWNFVARSHDEIAASRADWERQRRTRDPSSRFGVVDRDREPLAAPALPGVRLRPRGRRPPP